MDLKLEKAFYPRVFTDVLSLNNDPHIPESKTWC